MRGIRDFPGPLTLTLYPTRSVMQGPRKGRSERAGRGDQTQGDGVIGCSVRTLWLFQAHHFYQLQRVGARGNPGSELEVERHRAFGAGAVQRLREVNGPAGVV